MLLNETQNNNCIKNIQDCNQVSQNNNEIIKESKNELQSSTLVLSSKNHLSAAVDEIEHLSTTITPLSNLGSNLNENEKRRFNRTSPKIYSTIDQSFLSQANASVEDLRRRTFSLGSASWIA